jgi:hypothetical protein
MVIVGRISLLEALRKNRGNAKILAGAEIAAHRERFGRKAPTLSDATLRAVQAHGGGATTSDVRN